VQGGNFLTFFICPVSLQVVKENEIEFSLAHALDFVKAGVEAIIQDEVTQRFDAAELTVSTLPI
jgi:hypothetical protein